MVGERPPLFLQVPLTGRGLLGDTSRQGCPYAALRCAHCRAAKRFPKLLKHGGGKVPFFFQTIKSG